MSDKERMKSRINSSIKTDAFEDMFKPNIHCIITNAQKLRPTPEEYEEIKRKNAISLMHLDQRSSEIMNMHTTI